MNLPLVSVIIATYNYGQYVEEAIDSVLQQTYPKDKIEIIVVDDGSTDGTKNKLQAYENRIRYFYQKNKGHAAALNYGVSRASGDIIFFLDADDMFFSTKIERIVQHYARYACDGVFHNVEVLNGPRSGEREYSTEKLNGLKKAGDDLYLLTLDRIDYSYKYITMLLSGQSYTRSLLTRIFPMPTVYRYFTDMYIRLIAAAISNKIAYDDAVLGYYRIHEDSCMKILSRNIQQKRLHVVTMHRVIKELKRRSGQEAQHLISLVESENNYYRFRLSQANCEMAKALVYICKYRPYPKKHIIDEALIKIGYILETVLPTSLYQHLRINYAKSMMKSFVGLYLRSEGPHKKS